MTKEDIEKGRVKKEESVLVCMREKDMPEPYTPCHKGKCRVCKQDVFYSKYVYANDAIIRKIVDSGNLVCVHCALESTRVADNEP